MQTPIADADQASVQSPQFHNVSPVSVTGFWGPCLCSCTVAKLPALPWTFRPGARANSVQRWNVEAEVAFLFKSVTLSTDKGSKELFLRSPCCRR